MTHSAGNRNEYHYRDADGSCTSGYIEPVVLGLLKTPGSRILEIGCGNGSFSHKLAAMGHRVTGVDDSGSGIEIARKGTSAARFICSSVYDLARNHGVDVKYDIVISLEVIEHLQYPRELLKAARQYLTRGGILILSTPYHGYVKNLMLSIFGKWDRHFSVSWDAGHLRFFSQKTLAQMLAEEGYSNIRFKFSGRFPLLWKSMICICETNGPDL